MRKLMVVGVILAMAGFSHALDCKAQFIDGATKKSIEGSLIQSEHFPARWDVDLGKYYFSVNELHDTTTNNEDFRLIVSKGPGYTEGSLLRGTYNSDGKMKLSFISGGDSMILTCSK